MWVYMAPRGVIAMDGTSEAFMATLRAEAKRWQDFIQRTGTKLEQSTVVPRGCELMIPRGLLLGARHSSGASSSMLQHPTTRHWSGAPPAEDLLKSLIHKLSGRQKEKTREFLSS